MLSGQGRFGRLIFIQDRQDYHSVVDCGGLDDSIARLLACEEPLPFEMVALHDSFGENVTSDQLREKYKFNEAAIVAAVEAMMKRRKQTGLAVSLNNQKPSLLNRQRGLLVAAALGRCVGGAAI